jgi:hypothetical protein
VALEYAQNDSSKLTTALFESKQSCGYQPLAIGFERAARLFKTIELLTIEQ